MGQFEVKAVIAFVLSFNGQEQLTWIGHSQGNTQIFTALGDSSSAPYLNAKIKKFIAFAPPIYMAICESKLLESLSRDNILFDPTELFGIEEWQTGACSMSSIQTEFEKYVCMLDPLLCDFNPKYDNEKIMPYMFSTTLGYQFAVSIALRAGYCGRQAQADLQEVRLRPQRKPQALRLRTARPTRLELSLINLLVRTFVDIDDKLGGKVNNAFLATKLKSLGKDLKQYTYESCGHLTFF